MRPSVCLNMIVKNEAHIMRRTLAMLCSKIRFDYWVVCDTGSTDATPEIVQEFFATEGIEGELHCDAWVNFAHNRTLALNYAFGKTDLLLVFDADDDICGAIALPSAVTHDEYQLKFGSPHGGGVSYVRTLLINNRKRFKYFSVVHEYISCLEPSPQNQTRVLDGDYCVVSGRGGARNQDPDKYLKDALLLEAAHAEAVQTKDPLYKRYAFYCANSYRDCGKPEDAIRWYKVTLSQDNWAQEKYLACLHLYRCYESLGQKELGFYYLVKAFAYDAERVECLHPLVVHYCCEGMNEVAHGYYRIVQAHYEGATLTTGSGESKLFFEPDKANFFLPYYMIIVADRVGDRACGIRMYEIIFTKKHPVLSRQSRGPHLSRRRMNICITAACRRVHLMTFVAISITPNGGSWSRDRKRIRGSPLFPPISLVLNVKEVRRSCFMRDTVTRRGIIAACCAARWVAPNGRWRTCP